MTGVLGHPTEIGPSPLTRPQAVFAMKLTDPRGRRVLFIVRIQTLIEYVHSASADACVPWDEWGRGAVVMEVSRGDGDNNDLYPLVHGACMIVVKKPTAPGIHGYYHNLYTFNFSRRGWGILPLRDEGDGAERRVGFEDGWNLLFRGSEGMSEWRFDSLGDGRFMYLVSPSCSWRVVVH